MWPVLLKGRHNFGKALESKLRSNGAHRERDCEILEEEMKGAPRQLPECQASGSRHGLGHPVECNPICLAIPVLRLFYSGESGSSEKFRGLPKVVPLAYGGKDLL